MPQHEAKVGLLLRISAPELEAAFWANPDVLRTYARCDVMALVYGITVNLLLLRVFRGSALTTLMALDTLQMGLHSSTAAAQLAWLVRRPASYQRHRMAVATANRLGRLLFMAARVLRTGSTSERARVVARTLGSLGSGGAAPGMLVLARLLVCEPAAYLGSSNFIVPLRFAVPLQLLTVLLALSGARFTACHLAGMEGLPVLLARACSALGRAACAASVVFGRRLPLVPELLAQRCAAPGGGAAGTALALVLFTHVAVIVLLPSFVIFQLELSLKTQWLRALHVRRGADQRRAELAAAWEADDSSQCAVAARALVAVTGLAACWFGCTALAAASPPLSCGEQAP